MSRGVGHGPRGLGSRLGDGGALRWRRVIHPAARCGPECHAGLGGSIKWAAVSVV